MWQSFDVLYCGLIYAPLSWVDFSDKFEFIIIVVADLHA